MLKEKKVGKWTIYSGKLDREVCLAFDILSSKREYTSFFGAGEENDPRESKWFLHYWQISNY